MPSDERRARTAVGAAILLHVAALGGVRAVHVPAAASSALPSPPTEVDVEPLEPVAPTAAASGDGRAAAEAPSGAVTEARPRAAPTPAAAASSSEEEPIDARPGTPIVVVGPSAVALGIAGAGGTNPFLPRGPAPAATERPRTDGDAKKKVEGSFHAARIAHDVPLGLGPDGPVIHALEDAVYASLAPNTGRAVFLAIVDASGKVVEVRLVSSIGTAAGWADAGARAAKALAEQKVTLRGANGAEIRIEVTSDVLLPSGRRPGDAPIALQSPLGGGFDLSDIGAKPRRIVHARVIATQLL